eukprot:6202944-Pleurochrysis_carterae.AAC.1
MDACARARHDCSIYAVVRVLPAAGAVQIDPAGTGTQPYVSMRLCKKAPQDWRVVDDGPTAAGRFDQPRSSVTDVMEKIVE